MRIRFTKMQGAGNDFVVLNETQTRLHLRPAQYRWLADRHFGVGADQILTVRATPSSAVDFEYIIHNADGGEVEQCGNGARCFAKYVHDKGLTTKTRIKVLTRGGVIEPVLHSDGRVTVNMGEPVFELPRIPFDATGLTPEPMGHFERWPINLEQNQALARENIAQTATILVACVSMGNPHAVQVVSDVDSAPVANHGPLIESHARFPARVNAGFMQVLSRTRIALRVYERGAGETLACGTGACAAVVAGIRLGLLDAQVDVDTRGGQLTIQWGGAHGTQGGAHDASHAASSGSAWQPVLMTGPATTVFESDIDVPDNL
jgi:diaminopimelate epimerase